MANPNLFAVLQKELVNPGADPLKRAFSTFSNLTDADAVRLAIAARGILMRHLGHDAARALQMAVQAEGIPVVTVAESELPRLPESRPLHRVSLSEEAFSTYDLMGNPAPIAWNRIALLAAGAVHHFEITRTHGERTVLQSSPISGVWPRNSSDTSHKIDAESQLLLDILLDDGTTRFQIDAAQFPFNYVIEQPGSSALQKFVWLVREFRRHATQAILNCGARDICSGKDAIPAYPSRQAFTDEIVWLLWHSARRTDPPKS